MNILMECNHIQVTPHDISHTCPERFSAQTLTDALNNSRQTSKAIINRRFSPTNMNCSISCWENETISFIRF